MSEQVRPVDTTAAEAYEQFLVPGLFGPWTHDMVDFAGPQAGEHVLDVACGTGTALRLAAERITTSGRGVGLDIDPGMITVAHSLTASTENAVLEWHCGSALEMPFEDGTFDVALCLQGLQFFPDRLAGLVEIRRVLKATGRLVASVWGAIEHCKGHYALAQALERHDVDPSAALRPFSLGDADALRELACKAGFRDANVRTVVKLAHFASPKHFIESLASGAPSTRHALAKVPESARNALVDEVSMALAPYVTEGGVAFPNASHMLLARPQCTECGQKESVAEFF